MGLGILPYAEQVPLYETISPISNTLSQVLATASLQGYLRTPIAMYRCPSDTGAELGHGYRLLSGFDTSGYVKLPGAPSMGPPAGSSTGSGASPAGIGTFHSGHNNQGVFGVPTATSNYVGSFGDSWNPACTYIDIREVNGSGAFGGLSRVRIEDFQDGASQTFLTGERIWESFGAVWSGVDAWDHFDTQGLSMVVGTAFYEINSKPEPYNLSCDGKGAAGFSSRHPGGAQFLMGDGAVRFVKEDVEFRVSPVSSELGVFQRLARRDDGQSISSE